MLIFLSFLSHTACAEAVLRLIPVSLQQVYGAAELHSSIALSCALQIRMITIRRQDQALDSFEASACSSLHTSNDASLLVLTYTRFRQKRGSCAPRQAASGHGWTESRVVGHGLDASWSQIPRRARRRRPRSLSSARQRQRQQAAAGPWARGAGRGAPGIWILGPRNASGAIHTPRFGTGDSQWLGANS